MLKTACGNNTIRSYQKALELLFDYVKEKKKVPLAKVTFEMIDRKMLSEFLIYLEKERNCSPTTRSQRLHSIRAFYAYAAENNIMSIAHYEEIQKVDSAKVAEKLVEHMSEEAIKAVIAEADTTTNKGLRDMFLMLFLYKTGARIEEALNVELRHKDNASVSLQVISSKPLQSLDLSGFEGHCE